ncbi:MAG: Maf family protein [Proteobacteria bacterium]|nr:Maf family protein [Pseudomonadota bacterium]
MTLTLASKSAARRAVLSGAGVVHDAAGSGVDEDAVKAELLARNADPRAIAEALAEKKALAVSATRPGLVIGADQTLDLEGRLYDKVETLAAARERLRTLRGRPHQLHSAVVVSEGERIVWRVTESATLAMRDFSDAFLEAYLDEDGAEALGSVGCYRLEGPGVQLFDRIDGDYFTILGLPLMGLLEFLRGRGVLTS